MAQRHVIFVVGATATGKSEWALNLAREFDGVIVNCDSVQVYKKLDIGSAKPSKAEQALVPHYLLDYVSAPEEMTAGNYCRDFYEALKNIPEEKPVFVVGGTGFYFMAIEKGMYPVIPVPAEIQSQVAEELQTEEGAVRLHAEMTAADPEYGAKIHLSDRYRIGRAVELIRSQGKSVTQIQREFEVQRAPFPYPLLKIGPQWDREVLRERIRVRVQNMMQAGLVAEVQGLLDEGLAAWAPMSSVGYKETLDFLKGTLNQEQLFEEIVKNTHQLAKRQRTWFQRDSEIQWFDGSSGFAEARAVVEKFLKP
ncbi:tRNA (adenosine(37)-N6)-dimethylallyltransferase MiaA [Bdellovibrio bacteriovorus]|uniref:tRNA (adenosine(37)-N6)-dimethylallyltransferase MiaA n=1 Tax=Bdellovibrio bacteriovorus TaxID=959 RepID=UPI0021D37203|nr:tRNA (adenosine(37)-N6)-dimethylallyltransferase MiaA [Bdellovibrio bacteriovorus]UXR63876.1 tRNA (adenosine(37)-N6)-dimethylallyltransferase MiaA [Bdellovibrio bacteriovorus]